jgi:hypothetical protein
MLIQIGVGVFVFREEPEADGNLRAVRDNVVGLHRRSRSSVFRELRARLRATSGNFVRHKPEAVGNARVTDQQAHLSLHCVASGGMAFLSTEAKSARLVPTSFAVNTTRLIYEHPGPEEFRHP